MNAPLDEKKQCVKGQSISKCFFGVSISSKKRTKTVRFPPKNDFRSFFWGNRRYQKAISKLTDLYFACFRQEESQASHQRQIGTLLSIIVALIGLKGQLISKWFFSIFDFLKKTNENRFLEEIKRFSFVFLRKSKTSKTLSKLSDL